VANPKTPELEPLSRNQILIFMGVTAVVLLAIAKIWQKLGGVRLLPVQFNLQALFWSLGLAAGITIASSIIYRLWPAYRLSALEWTDLIWLGLLPGLSEELLFRGVMLPALGLDLFAVLVSSVLFGVLHLSGNGQWAYVVWAAIVGFALGYCTLVTGNLVVPVVAHIITNLISGLLWKIKYWQKQQTNVKD
jgi:uncharacterized protein